MKANQNNTENRSDCDRRKRKIPPLKYLILGGRRKRIRRKEDKNKLIILDVYSSSIFFMAILILAFSALDGLLTLHLISSGAIEINPFMSSLIDFNPRFYLTVKCIITIIGVIFLIVLRNYKSRLLCMPISKLLTTTALVFFIVIVYELYIILY